MSVFHDFLACVAGSDSFREGVSAFRRRHPRVKNNATVIRHMSFA